MGGFLLAGAALAGLVVPTVLLLLGLRALARRAARRDADRPAVVETPTLPSQGYLSDVEREEQLACAKEIARDLERLAMVEQAVLRRTRRVCERAARRLLPPHDRAWYRLHTGEYDRVGGA